MPLNTLHTTCHAWIATSSTSTHTHKHSSVLTSMPVIVSRFASSRTDEKHVCVETPPDAELSVSQGESKMVINLPPGAAVSVTRNDSSIPDNTPFESERPSSRIAKRTFDDLFGGSVRTLHPVGALHGVDRGVSALGENLEMQ